MNPRSRHAAPTGRRGHRPVRPPRPGRIRPIRWALWLAGAGVAAMGAAVAFQGISQLNTSMSSANVPLLGSSVSNPGQLARDTSEFGHMPVVRVYYPGLPSSNAWTGGLAEANRSAVVVSFKALPNTILSGADDAALSHFFDTAPTGRPIYYSYFHEPEDNIARGEFTLAAYKAAWTHVVALAARAHNPDLHSTLILMAFDLRPFSHRDWKSYLPAGGIISTIGWDAYPDLGRKAEPPSEFMAPAVAAAKSAGLPFGFAEFGMSTPVDRASWLSEVGSYLMKSGALFGTLFDSAVVRPSMQVNDQGSISTWRQFVQASAAANGASGGQAPAPSAPSPAASRSSGSPAITGLALSPSRLAVTAKVRTNITFRLSRAATITICVLTREGTVLRMLAKPGASAGLVRISYLGRGLPPRAGIYKILVVASNAAGSSVAEQTLTVTRS